MPSLSMQQQSGVMIDYVRYSFQCSGTRMNHSPEQESQFEGVVVPHVCPAAQALSFYCLLVRALVCVGRKDRHTGSLLSIKRENKGKNAGAAGGNNN
jgi:hypothetical protein